MSSNSDVYALILVSILFGGFIFVAGATSTNQTDETIYFETLTFGENKALPTNLAPIPTTWGGYILYGDIVYTSVAPPSANQICDYDTTVERTAAAGSARLDPYLGLGENTAREINSESIPINPGDRIVFSCWIKTSASGTGDTNPQRGARTGIDFYDTQRITGLQSDGQHGVVPSEDNQAVTDHYVAWNTGVWTQRTIDFIVPATLQADGWAGHPAGGSYVPTTMILWMQAVLASDTGQAWFADVELYINSATYTVATAASSGGSVSPSGTTTVASGSSLSVLATANANYVFSKWVLNGVDVGAVNPYVLTGIAGNSYTLTAVFTSTIATVDLTVASGANGSVLPVGVQTLNVGQAYTYTATADPTFTFDHWTLDTTNLGASNPLSLVTLLSMDTQTLTAIFAAVPPTQVTLTVATSGSGTVDLANGLHTFNVGDTVTFIATPTSQNIFNQWTFGAVNFTTNPLTLTITSGMDGKTLTALFKPSTQYVDAPLTGGKLFVAVMNKLSSYNAQPRVF